MAAENMKSISRRNEQRISPRDNVFLLISEKVIRAFGKIKSSALILRKNQ